MEFGEHAVQMRMPSFGNIIIAGAKELFKAQVTVEALSTSERYLSARLKQAMMENEQLRKELKRAKAPILEVVEIEFHEFDADGNKILDACPQCGYCVP